MKKITYLLLLSFLFNFSFGQEDEIKTDTIPLNQVVVKKQSNKKEIKNILKKIRYNLRHNYNLDEVKYQVDHISIKDYKDTLVNNFSLKQFNIKVLNQYEVEGLLMRSSKNSLNIDTSNYTKYEPDLSNGNHWLALSIFYNSLSVSDFKFFDISSGYKYKIEREQHSTTVFFSNLKYYSGYFTYSNSDFNLIRIAYKNTKPYDYYYRGNLNNILTFDSTWNYNKLTVLLDFKQLNTGRFVLKKLNAMEELTNFEFKRYNENKVQIDQGRDINFYTKLSMKILD